MIRYIQHDQIDFEAWDRCIRDAFNGNMYGYSWYLDLVCPGWSALVEDEYKQVMPLPSWEKAGIRYLAQPYFTQQLGLFSQSALSPATMELFLAEARDQFRYIDINLNTYNCPDTEEEGYSPQTNYELDLIHPYDKLEAGYSDNLRRNLRKAGNGKLSLVKNMRPEVIIELFRKNRGRSLQKLGDEQYALLTRLVYTMIGKGRCQVWGTVDERNEVVAGIIWGFSHNKAIFLFSAVAEEGKRVAAMPWMIDRFIRENAGTSSTLDFEGSNDTNLGRFYAGFGSARVTYYRYRRNNLPFLLKVALSFYRWLRSELK